MSAVVQLLDLPPFDPRNSPTLLSALFERLLKMPTEKARPVFAAIIEQWLNQPSKLAPGAQTDDSWKAWFDFCDSFTMPSSRTYQEILEDEDRR